MALPVAGPGLSFLSMTRHRRFEVAAPMFGPFPPVVRNPLFLVPPALVVVPCLVLTPFRTPCENLRSILRVLLRATSSRLLVIEASTVRVMTVGLTLLPTELSRRLNTTLITQSIPRPLALSPAIPRRVIVGLVVIVVKRVSVRAPWVNAPTGIFGGNLRGMIWCLGWWLKVGWRTSVGWGAVK